MDFYSNPKRMNYFRIILLIALIILLGINSYGFFVNGKINYWSLFANVLMIFSMLIQIRKYYSEKRTTIS